MRFCRPLVQCVEVGCRVIDAVGVPAITHHLPLGAFHVPLSSFARQPAEASCERRAQTGGPGLLGAGPRGGLFAKEQIVGSRVCAHKILESWGRERGQHTENITPESGRIEAPPYSIGEIAVHPIQDVLNLILFSAYDDLSGNALQPLYDILVSHNSHRIAPRAPRGPSPSRAR